MEHKSRIIEAKEGTVLVKYSGWSQREDRFQVVEQFPINYVIWNIGRENFPFEGCIPLAKMKDKIHVDMKSLKALKVKDEKTALMLLRQAGRGEIDFDKFNELMKNEAM